MSVSTDELPAATPPGKQAAKAVAQAMALYAHEDGRRPTIFGVTSRQVDALPIKDRCFADHWNRASMRRGYQTLVYAVFGWSRTLRGWEARDYWRTEFWVELRRDLQRAARAVAARRPMDSYRKDSSTWTTDLSAWKNPVTMTICRPLLTTKILTVKA